MTLSARLPILLAQRFSILTDHSREINEQAEAHVEELRAAAQAAHERLNAGVARLRQQADATETPEPHDAESFPPETDPIFATREFDVPPQALGGLVNFDDEKDD